MRVFRLFLLGTGTVLLVAVWFRSLEPEQQSPGANELVPQMERGEIDLVLKDYPHSPNTRLGHQKFKDFVEWLSAEQPPDYLREKLKEAMGSWNQRKPNAPISDSISDIMDYLLQASLDSEEAAPYVAIIKHASENGDPEAMRSLADLILMDLVEPLDPSEAFWLYHTAADAGDALAARQVGFHYEQGLGVDVDLQKAVEWYLHSAELGHVDALVDLGFMHSSSAFGDPGLVKAHAYYDRAIGLGSVRGLFFKALDFLSGWEGQPPDSGKAFTLLDKAAALNEGDAHMALAMLYGLERFNQIDPVRSLAHLMAAIHLRNPDARYIRGNALLSREEESIYQVGWEDMTDLTIEGDIPAAIKLASELIEHEKYERIEDTLSILEWAATKGSVEATRMLLELSFDSRLPADKRPDKDHWLEVYQSRRQVDGELIQFYQAEGMTLMDSYAAVRAMSEEERYKELLRIKDQEGYTIQEGIKAPRPIHAVKPSYPDSMRLGNMGGTVFVTMVVRTNGTVTNLVIESSPHPAFSKAAQEALRQWEFYPAVDEDGRPVNTRIRIPIPFNINE